MRKRVPRERRRYRFNLAVLVLALAAIGALAPPALAQEAPIPPPPTRWVTDEPDMLPADVEAALDERLEAYERQTGHQVVVWIGDSIGSTPLEDFAVKTFEAWKPGREGKDDGVLVIVLARDRRIAIEVGYGLEPQLPDARASRIIHDVMVPKLRAGDANGAIRDGVEGVLTAIEGKPFVPDADGQQPAKEPLGGGRILLLLLLVAGFLVLLVTNPTLALHLLFVVGSGRGGFGGGFGGGGGGFDGGGGRSGGGGARGSW